jgi:hypothetical protein
MVWLTGKFLYFLVEACLKTCLILILFEYAHLNFLLRFHWKMLRNWQRMNQMVRLIDLQHCHHTNNRPERTEVNNNGHLEQGNTSGNSQVFEMNAFV